MDQSDREAFERLEEQIRELAYLLWEAGGRQHDRSLEHWLEAERQILEANAAARRAATVVEAMTQAIDVLARAGEGDEATITEDRDTVT